MDTIILDFYEWKTFDREFIQKRINDTNPFKSFIEKKLFGQFLNSIKGLKSKGSRITSDKVNLTPYNHNVSIISFFYLYNKSVT